MSDEHKRRKITPRDAKEFLEDLITHADQANQLGGDPMDLATTRVKIPGLNIDPGSPPFLDLETVDEDHVGDSRVFKVILTLFEPSESVVEAPEVKIEADADLMFSLAQAVKLEDAWMAGILAFVDGMRLFTHSFNRALDWTHEDQGENYKFTAKWQTAGEPRPVWVGNFIVPKRLIELADEDEVGM
jgi:hypothetical protein